jgi:hypothetical protein
VNLWIKKCCCGLSFDRGCNPISARLLRVAPGGSFLKLPALAAVVVGALLCNVVQAQQVLSSFTLTSLGEGNSSPGKNETVRSGTNLPTLLTLDLGPNKGHDDSNDHGQAGKEGVNLYAPFSGRWTGHDDSRNGDGVVDLQRNKHDSDKDRNGVCISAIPEPSDYAVLLGLISFSLVVWRRNTPGKVRS